MLANDLSAIHTCISDYFDALYTGDTALLIGKVFSSERAFVCRRY